ncbi:hypothetical protein [Streptomyces sp. NBC_00842]|uniref:hypothetical protein n=1 Tax=Streptomyces sp. NBC_00842 TaxID=2975848 RepID=UPI00387001BA|nr:hypothetical protein OH821_17185 [Streptomyces sp. NBC_00842]
MPVLVEMGWGGLVQAPATITWTDITSRVDMVQGVTITRGASDELSETQPGAATLTLDNQDGALTPGNPNSPFSPFVRRNAPIRVSQAVMPVRTGAAPYPVSMLGDDFDAPRLNSSLWTNAYGGSGVAGGQARIPLTPGVGAGLQSAREWKLPGSSLCARLSTLPTANGSSVARANWTIDSQTNGTRIGFQHNAVAQTLRCISEVGFSDGASVDLPYSPIDHLWVRIRESVGTVYWETSGDGFGWTVRRTLATPGWASTDTLMVSMTTSRTGGTPDYIEWDYLGAQVRPRFYGVVNEFPVGWEGLYSSVTISATDLFKRLNRLPPLVSCLSEEIKALGPLAYYPLTEPTGATSAGDLSGTTAGPLSITQVGAGGTLDFGTAAGPASAPESLPTFTPVSATAGKCLTADMGQVYAAASAGQWNMQEAWFSTSTPGRVIFALVASADTMQIVWSLNGSGALQAETMQDGSTWQTATVTSGNLADGRLHHFAYDEITNQVWVDGVLKTSGFVQWMSGLRTLTVGAYAGARLWSGTIGHIALTATPSTPLGPTMATHYQAGTTAFAGERADARIARLAKYAGIGSVTVFGTTHDPIAGQGEGGSGVVAQMREVEATESGRLYAERDYYGLAYQSRDLRYNPDPGAEVFMIAYADLETADVQLADDDQKLCNQVRASRPGGATQLVTDPASIFAFGVYEQQLSILKTTDNSVADAASWIVSRYADPEPELREVPVEAYTMASYLDILDADISSYFTVYNLPSQATASELRVTVEGYTETIREKSHVIRFRTSASSADSVWVLDDPYYARLGSTSRLAY